MNCSWTSTRDILIAAPPHREPKIKMVKGEKLKLNNKHKEKKSTEEGTFWMALMMAESSCSLASFKAFSK